MRATQPEPIAPPDGVRNDFLDRLQEVVPPEPVSWAPQTVGWLLLGALAALGLVWVVWRFWRRWEASRFRRDALAELAELERNLEPGSADGSLRRLPGLVKRTALAVYPRERVAGLTGAAWLDFLDETSGSKEFSTGAGQLLKEIPYLPAERLSGLDEGELRTLFGLTRRWIRRGAGRP